MTQQYGLDLLSTHLDPNDRIWQPAMRSKLVRLKFPTMEAAETYATTLRTTQRHIDVRVVALDVTTIL